MWIGCRITGNRLDANLREMLDSERGILSVGKLDKEVIHVIEKVLEGRRVVCSEARAIDVEVLTFGTGRSPCTEEGGSSDISPRNFRNVSYERISIQKRLN